MINIQGIKDNAQHIAGIIVGKLSKCNYSKAHRGTHMFSTVSANLTAQGFKLELFPYKMWINK